MKGLTNLELSNENQAEIRRIGKVGGWAWGFLVTFIATLTLFSTAYAGFTNAGFESDAVGPTITSWNKLSYTWGSPSVIPTMPPTTESDLGLTAPVADNGLTSIVGSGTDTNTSSGLHYPLYGTRAALINNGGNTLRVSSIDQTAPMTNADVDPVDGKVHVRFAIAPVLQNPGHPANQQPYFFVEITNVTKGAQLFNTFNFSGQSGVPWVTVGGYQYTNWQVIDVAPGPGVLDVGDQVKVKIIAAGCGQGGHEGHVYVDSGDTGSSLPGLLVSATGPSTANVGDTITYTYTYTNNGVSPVTNTTVNAALPPNTTFVSYNAGGTTCIAPSSGGTGTISCNFGTMAPNSSGSFTITALVGAGAAGSTINNGNYPIQGDTVSPVLGPIVKTDVPSSVASLTDLAVTVTDGTSAIVPSGNSTYTITVINNGPTAVTGATVAQTVSNLTAGAWTCAGSAGSTCAASGSGAITDTVNLPVGASVTYTLAGTAGASGNASTVVSVTPPAGITDSNTANNTMGDTNNIGALHSVAVTTSGSGSVTSVPNGISCGANCSNNYADGTSVYLTASPAVGQMFTGWTALSTSGATDGSTCNGTTTNPCHVDVNGGNASLTANFIPAVAVTAVVGANGTVTGTVDPNTSKLVAAGSTVSFTITPDSGYNYVVGGDCNGTITGSGPYTYTINPANYDCTVDINFGNVANFGNPPTAQNDVAPAGTRTLTPVSNDAAVGGASIVPSTVDLDPTTIGVQKTITTSQGTWKVVDNSGTVSFTPAVGFYGTATLTYAVSDSYGLTATATMSVPIDPSGVVYDSKTRQPLAGAAVTILYNGGNASAYVVGPTTVTTDSQGRYAFFLQGSPSGTFSLTVSDAGYRFQSTLIPPETANSGNWPSAGGPITGGTTGAPGAGVTSPYYLSGPYPASDITNNNIPLDSTAVAPVAPIPTLSQWAMLLLTCMLALLGLAAMRRIR